MERGQIVISYTKKHDYIPYTKKHYYNYKSNEIM